nr:MULTISPECIES: luciferase family protein [unclassified Phaeobacter]
MFDGIVARNDDRLHYQLSQYEKHNQAIWLRDVEGGNPATGLGGEIGHFHPSDGSMHTILSPSDAKQVLDKGWGELHSMARFKRIFPTETFVMLYAPARAEHVPVIRDIIEAATCYALPRGNNSIKG